MTRIFYYSCHATNKEKSEIEAAGTCSVDCDVFPHMTTKIKLTVETKTLSTLFPTVIHDKTLLIRW